MSQTSDQQRFTISEMAADWHEPMVPQRIIIIIIIYLLKKTTYSKRKASEQDRQAQGALTSALMVQVQ